MNVFDFDGTIYAGDSSIDFYFFCLKHNLALLRYVPSQILGMLLYSLKIIPKESFKELFFSFLRGITNVDDTIKIFWNFHRKKIRNCYFEIQNDDDCIISASPRFLLLEICNRIGVKNLIATNIDKFSARLYGKNCYGKNKVIFLREKFPDASIGYFYSDSKSDEALAKIASKAFFVKNNCIFPWFLEENYEQHENLM